MTRIQYADIRAHRRRWGLSQSELGWLIGITNRTTVSKIEMSKRRPKPEVIIACAVLFDLPLDSIFPGFQGEIECAICERATALRGKLAGRMDDLSTRKCALLDDVLTRISKRTQQPPS